MVASMTGFGRKRFSTDNVIFTIEIRTLNHRHLDLHCRLPETLSALEMPIRGLVKEYISRGRVDVRVNIEPSTENGQVELNQPIYRAYCTVIRDILKEHKLEKFDPVALLTLPDILKSSKLDPDDIKESFMSPLTLTLKQLSEDRKREGNLLWQDLMEKISRIKEFAADLAGLAKDQQGEVGERFRQRLSKLEELDDNRILTEIAILADKSDINEELVRLTAHLQEFVEAGKRKEPIGRRLEFLGQEMLREVNTIASKSAIYPISKITVEIKTELEKIREQVQNIE